MNIRLFQNLTLIAACLLVGMPQLAAQEIDGPSDKASSKQLVQPTEKDEDFQWLVEELDLFGDQMNSGSRSVNPFLPLQGWTEFQAFLGIDSEPPQKPRNQRSKRATRKQVAPVAEPKDELELKVDDFMDRLLKPDDGSVLPWDFQPNMLSQVTGLIRGFGK